MLDQRPALFLDHDCLSLATAEIASLSSLQDSYALVITAAPSGAPNSALKPSLDNAGITPTAWIDSSEDGSLQTIAAEHALDLARSFAIGDQLTGAQVGQGLGVFGLYLLSGRGGHALDAVPQDLLVCHTLKDACLWIHKHPNPTAQLSASIKQAAELIRSGENAAFPTETVYGLGGDVFQPDAIKNIFAIKRRPMNNPLIAHISRYNMLDQLVNTVPVKAKQAMNAFWPGPLTVVLPKKNTVSDVVTAGKDSVAIRMPGHPIALELISQVNSPVAAPSANAFTHTSPTSAQHVEEQLEDRCKHCVDGGACRVGLESTVVSFTGPDPVLLRPGGLSREALEAVIGPIQLPATQPADATPSAESPGLHRHHYAPKTPLAVYEEIPHECINDATVGILLYRGNDVTYAGPIEILSDTGDNHEASANFYAALRRLDALGLRQLVAQWAPDKGLGIAINNRLKKASRGRLPH